MGLKLGGDILHDVYASDELMVRFAIDESSEGCSLRLELGLEELMGAYNNVSDRTCGIAERSYPWLLVFFQPQTLRIQ